jgi:hypothetical protein
MAWPGTFGQGRHPRSGSPLLILGTRVGPRKFKYRRQSPSQLVAGFEVTKQSGRQGGY